MDMVTMTIIDSTMVSICREMGITLMKTSYSTIFNEGLDFTCALADADGEMIAVADFCPAQIGGMPLLIQSSVRELSTEPLEEGDVIVHNDPYRGGLHTPEHTFFKPIFVDGELMGYAVSIGHVAEIGGSVPGGFASEATEIFHEGLRVPPVKIKTRGKDNDDVWKLLLANVRTPRDNYGDYRALIGAVELGEQRIEALIRKYGKEVFTRTCRDLLDYSEARMRAELTAFPDGHYDFEDYMEDDGIEDRPYSIHVECHVQGDEIVVDFTGSDKQAKGPINATLGVTWCATYNALLHLTDPSIPKNSGCFRPIKVMAPPGTVVNVDYPAPEVGGNTETHPRIAYTVIGALAQAVPERAPATDAATHCNFLFGGIDPVTGEYYVCYDFLSAGWGGRPFADGNNAVNGINGNCRMIPDRGLRGALPLAGRGDALVAGYRRRRRYRGGLGVTKRYLPESADDRQPDERPPQAGALGPAWRRPGGKAELLHPARRLRQVADRHRGPRQGVAPQVRRRDPQGRRPHPARTTGGGGGWGDPHKRDHAKVERGRRRGLGDPRARRTRLRAGACHQEERR